MFEEDAVFSNVRFVQALFGGSRFEGKAYFYGCEFAGPADFEHAVFVGDATFAEAPFHGYTNFVSAVFEAAADFKFAQFGNEAAHTTTMFSHARFEGRAEFDHVSMTGQIAFDDATLSGRVTMSQVKASGLELSLQGVVFPRYVDMDVHSKRLDCSRTRFLGGGQIRANQTSVILEAAQVTSPLTITSAAEAQAVLVSVRSADVGGLLLSGVDMRDCRFQGSHNLDRLRMEATTFADVGWRFGFARRRVIAEEVDWKRVHRRAKGWQRVEGVSKSKDEALDPAVIASIYRNLRKAREDSKDEPGAADFYYGEMEMRRHDNSRSFGERLVVVAYWLLSGYGLRASRSLAALGVLLLFATASFDLCGFAFPRDPYAPNPGDAAASASWDACWPDDLGEFAESVGRFDTWVFATSAALAVIPRPEVALTTQGQTIRLVLRILGPLLIGLAFLSLRGRVKR